MKKKLSLLLLAIFIIPVFAIFGCDEISSYSIIVKSSSTSLGIVSLSDGTFEEGETVTLTATRRTGERQNGYFICWLHQNSTQLEHGEVYNIENSTSEDDIITTSKITFTANKDTQGTYTAVFGGLEGSVNNMMYAKLDSFRLAKKSTYNSKPAGETEDSDSFEVLATTNLSIQQGTTSATLIEAYSETEKAIKNNLIYDIQNVTKVLHLASNQHVLFQINGHNLRVDIAYHSNTTLTQTNNYSYQVSYAENTYAVSFHFNATFGETAEDYVAIFTFKNLT